MSNSNHRFSSHLHSFDDSFDADDSLLVSPAPKQSGGSAEDEAATDDFDESYNFGEDILNERQSNNANNNSFSDSSDSFDVHTPMKQFSYKSAMDALDELQSSTKKAKRRRRTTMFSPGGRSFVEGLGNAAYDSLDESYAAAGNDNSFLVGSHYHGFSERLDEDSREDDSLVGEQKEVDVDSSNKATGFESKEVACDALEYSEDNVSDELDAKRAGVADLDCVGKKDAAREVTWENVQHDLGIQENNSPESSEPFKEEQDLNSSSESSVFRQPTIRHHSSSEDDLELKPGYPINESFSETTAQYEHDGAQLEGKGDVSVAVEDDANGTSLDDMDRVDLIDVCVGGQEQSVQDVVVDQDDSFLDEDNELAAHGDNDLKLTEKSSSNFGLVLDTSIDFEEEYTPPTLGELSETLLSPIAKSSSPHNCENGVNDDLVVVAAYKTKQTTAGVEQNSMGASSLNTSRGLVAKCNSGTIFDVLSRPTGEESEVMTTGKVSEPIESNYSEGVQHNNNSDLEMSKTASSPDDSDERIDTSVTNKRQSLDDLSSVQNTYNSNSNALLQRLRGAAETRKREVTRGRYSLERKEQIMMEEKEVRQSMPTVIESKAGAVSASRASILPRPKKTFEGVDPYKPFTARPMPSTSVKAERTRKSFVSAYAKPSKTGLARKIAPEEDPYVPFKARPMPSATSRVLESAIGTKRKFTTALQPHPEQNKSTVKPAALKAKPPTRLLSGQDASNARQAAQRERIEKENAKIRRESKFIARDIPSRTASAGLVGEKILTDTINNGATAGGKENVGASRVKRTSSIAPFTSHSTRRAEERAVFDSERAIREETKKTEQMKRRQTILEKTSAEIEELRGVIR